MNTVVVAKYPCCVHMAMSFWPQRDQLDPDKDEFTDHKWPICVQHDENPIILEYPVVPDTLDRCWDVLSEAIPKIGPPAPPLRWRVAGCTQEDQ